MIRLKRDYVRLTRGTSVGAATGIRVKLPFSNGFLIRPFLCVTKDEIVAYCERQDENLFDDATNEMGIHSPHLSASQNNIPIFKK